MPELQDPKLYTPHHADPPARPSDAPPYAELITTTNFSFLRGASHADELVNRAVDLGYCAIGVADLNTFSGIVRMYEATKHVGLKLIIGTTIEPVDGPPLTLWATDRPAYARLCRLLTLGKQRAEKAQCVLHLDDVLDASEGLLAAAHPFRRTGYQSAPEGAHTTARAGSPCDERVLLQLKDGFGDRLSLVAACGMDRDHFTWLSSLDEISRHTGVAMLASNLPCYHAPERQPLQDVLTCIRHGCTIQTAGYKLYGNAERYLKSPEQMYKLFSDYPAAIERGLELADRCTFSLSELKYEYPHEVLAGGGTPIEQLTRLTWEGARKYYPAGMPDKVRAIVEKELRLIHELKIEAYFLTVYDLVRFARSRDILCQGRGSAANSAVCFCLGVTSVDPAKIDVLFERFISSARNEPPDIDVDFEHERREEVIQYIYKKYGRERAGMTAEIISYRGRSAVRDVGKAMGLGLDTIEQMAKRLDWWDRGTLTDEKLREVGLNPADRTIRLVIDLTSQLLGFPRHLGQHVGGMVMTAGPLCELVPIENAAMEDRTVIEWDKDDIDALGILKVDVLALGMLTCIAKAIRLLNATRPRGTPQIEMHTLPAEDPAVYDMICKADTVGVFQIESRAQMSMLPRLKPRKFYDLVIEVAIVRPGPIQGNMVHPYLKRRQGLEPVVYPKPELKKVLGETLGVPLFQEQAMRIAIVCAGFTPVESDRLRRAVTGFRRHGDIETFGAKFVNGMTDRGYEKEFAENCFAQLKGFSSYGFPESHAASFALLVYVSSWIKKHHPAIFATALLNSQPMGFYAPAQIVRDAVEHDVAVLPVDINASQWDCTLEGEAIVRLGFRQVRGFKESDTILLQAVRERLGRFTSINQLQQLTGFTQAILQRLAEADAFGSLDLSRRSSLWKSARVTADHPLPIGTDDEPAVDLPGMTMMAEVKADYAFTGLSLKQHPVRLVRDRLKSRKFVENRTLATLPQGRWVKVAGLVLIRQRPGTASGIVFETIEDETGVANLIIPPHIFDRYRPATRHASFAGAEGRVERQGAVVHVHVRRMVDLGELLEGYEQRSRDFH